MINNFIAYISKNSLKILFFTSIVICIIMASWFVIHGDIYFHTDIARDFLLLEDMVKNKPITLIGPRSGGISGVFHGTLWLYLNLPILILSFLYLIVYFFKRKRYHHFLSFSILLIPLSTFILFDIRHNFLQLKAIMNFLSAGKDLGKINLQSFFLSRIKGILIDGFVMMSEKYWFLILASITIPLILVLLKIVSNKKFKNRDLYILFFYFYLGFWLITFFYKGTIWSYYYWPTLPLAVIIFSSLGRLFKKKFLSSKTDLLSKNIF